MTRTSRGLLTAAAVAAVLAIAVIVGLQLNQRQQNVAFPSASPTVSASPATVVNPSASQGATATPPAATGTAAPGGAIYNDDFGFVGVSSNNPGSAATVRNESSSATVMPAFGQQGFVVSPDGKLIAFWKRGAGANGEGAQLRMFAVSGNSTEQTLVTLAADQRAGGIAWSSDGTGLLYSTETGNLGINGITNSATLNIYELTATGRHGTTISTEANRGLLYRPIAWDRSANLAAAGITGEGGFMSAYVTVRTTADNSFTVQRVDTAGSGMSMGSVRSSSDAKFVLGVEVGPGTIRWWPLAEFAANKSQAGAGQRGALWRPGTHQIGFLSVEQFWLGDVDKAGPLGLCCTAFSGAPAASGLLTFRADGSAVLLGTGPSGQIDYTLVQLSNDPLAAKSTGGDRVTFKDALNISASVRFR